MKSPSSGPFSSSSASASGSSIPSPDSASSQSSASSQRSFIRVLFTNLFFQLVIAIVAGILVGWLFPSHATSFKPLATGFIKLIKMIIAPIIFVMVVLGIARMRDIAALGRIAAKAFTYFIIATLIALVLGLVSANIVKPGQGFMIPSSTFTSGTNALNSATKGGKLPSFADFVLEIIPDTAVGAFSEGIVLQVLLLALLTGVALATLNFKDSAIMKVLSEAESILFTVMGWIMRLAPIGAFGAMASIIGQYGIGTIKSFALLILCCYGTGLIFVCALIIFSGAVLKVNLLKFIAFAKEEFGLALGTASTESVLPRIMEKLVRAGNKEATTGFVVPTGYSFNMDGATIYLGICMVFLAQATGHEMSIEQQVGALFILLLTSKGMAGVPGSSFLALSASASALGLFPVAAVAILLGADRIMDSMRVFINLLGNCVATFTVSRWEKELNDDELKAALAS